MSDPVTSAQTGAAAEPGPSARPSVGSLTRATFEPFVGETFSVDLTFCGIDPAGAPVPRPDAYPTSSTCALELVEVTRYTELAKRSEGFKGWPREPFALLSRGPHDSPLHNDVHVVSHRRLGSLTLLLTPVSVSPAHLATDHPEGRFYETIFS